MSGGPELRILDHLDEVAREAAEFFLCAAEESVARSGGCRVALSGGTTPKALFTALITSPGTSRFPWSRVQFFFGDERCIAPTHPESNFGMADAVLLRPLKIEAQRVFRMRGEDEQPERAAQNYEDLMRKEFALAAPAIPRFDLLLLGLGDDAHMASLFPNTPALDERRRLVVTNQAPKGVAQRLTITVPVINHARTILFLVTGSGKASAVRTVLEEPDAAPARYPARLVQPIDGRVIWFLDRPAAATLQRPTRMDSSHEE